MKLLPLILMLLAGVLCQACQSGQSQTPAVAPAEADSTLGAAPAEPERIPLAGDSLLTAAARYYAAQVSDERSRFTLDKVDSLASADMQDMRDRCNYVFYPFSGPDFLYPYRLFPHADAYFLLGLEKPGTALTDTTASAAQAKVYTRALSIYLRSSFFRTNSMKSDLDNETIDGTVPVLSMLMAGRDCQIMSVRFLELDAEGLATATERPTSLAEIRFFSNATPWHEQRLLYYSGNVADSAFPESLRRFLYRDMEGRQVVSFLKAASYLMHKSYFSKIRNSILDNSFAVLQDDSGIPYRFFQPGWDCVLYGQYRRPISIFADLTYQADLDSLYRAPGVRPLDFRIGYNNPSNWMAARKR